MRLAAPRKGFSLFRNNVGVLKDERGTPVRYGLANESVAVNQKWKSGDLIGWHSFIILPEHVGRRIARFVSRECKPEGWHYAATAREEAQARWAQLVNDAGGDACFAATVDALENPAYGF